MPKAKKGRTADDATPAAPPPAKKRWVESAPRKPWSRVAIVTGGAQGIGRGVTLALLRGLWSVVAVDLSADGIADAQKFFKAQQANGALPAGAIEHLAIRKGDCADAAVAKATVAHAVKTWKRLDLVVNNAGGAGLFVPLQEVTPERWSQYLGANLSSTFFFSQAAADALTATRGSIVNIASTRAVMSEPNSEAYAAAKGGVVGLTHAMAATLAGKVNVNCICPGWIDVSGPEFGANRTQYALSDKDKAQHFAGRVGTAQDVAEAVLYLAGAPFVCGQTLTLDGGMTKKMIYEE